MDAPSVTSIAPALPQTRRVPNAFPSLEPGPLKLAIVGEAPGSDEAAQGAPFVGMAGKFLDNLLSKHGIVRPRCFIGNVCQFQPPGNDMLKWLKTDEGKLVRDDGLELLKSDLAKFDPNCVLLLGKTALHAAKGTWDISNWRGSLFESSSLFGADGRPLKCVASYHPANVLRQYSNRPLLEFDLLKAKREGLTKKLSLPERTLTTDSSFNYLCAKLAKLVELREPIACDIEGGIADVSCISFAQRAHASFVVPLTNMDGTPVWAPEQEAHLWTLIASVLEDPLVPKIWQNGLYDRFVLQMGYGIQVRGNADDTMLKAWERYCEMEKSLGFLCSLFIDEPYYKSDMKSNDFDTFLRYCARDSAVTFEINEKLTPTFKPGQLAHYRLNIEMLNPLLYMEMRGIRYDSDLAELRLEEVRGHVWSFQHLLNVEASKLGACELPDFTAPRVDVLKAVQSVCCMKRKPEVPKKEFTERGYWVIQSILSDPALDKQALTEQECGQIATVCKFGMNTKSPKFKDFLYKTCKLPVQYKKDPATKEFKPTTNYEALLKLTKKSDLPALRRALELSRLRTRAQMLTILPYKGRMHCSLNLVGSETGRVTSSKSMLYATPSKRVGANMQTIPDDWNDLDPLETGEEHPLTQGMRDLFRADEGCYLIKCDLKGADGWTIGAYLAMLGDDTLLEDLRFGIKPANLVAYTLINGPQDVIRHAHDRPALLAMCNQIDKASWQYFAGKVGTWGYFYLQGPRALAEMVFLQSDGKVVMTESQGREFQRCVSVRYNGRKLHDWMLRHLSSQSYPAKLTAPDGHVRCFWGRNSEKNCEILGEALAHLPQKVTTHATLLAAHKLWTDPENRRADNSLRVEPLHQVHDELLMQCRQEEIEWAVAKVKGWFANPMLVAGQTITIPFSGAWGTAWSMDDAHKVGEIK